ncbi:MAG TPA: serine hydrolase domain-containing protein [Cyclobacteriaceae bacterium]|nr:serine hydrolase domain-containing protein [Cyclobacteriaceae bacterium]
MRLPYLLILAMILSACNKQPQETSTTTSTESSHAMPSTFRDSERVAKIKTFLPAVDGIFESHFKKGHFPGMSYAIIVDGQMVHAKAFGIADIKMMTPATTQTAFRIASMTKSFTALSILKLRDEGKLSLSDPVSKYIPEMAKVKNFTSDAPVITIEHLLTMSAGFPEDNPWGDRQLADTDEELLALIKQGISFSNVPGTEFEYSNLGFGMLGRIVSAVAGKPYEQYINENILKPLGMNDSKWEYTEYAKEKFAPGYRWEDDQWKEEPILHDGIFGAMGGLICSAEDFAKYVALHLSAWPPRDGDESPVAKRSTLREMQQLQRLGGFFAQAKNSKGEPCPTLTGYGYGLGYRKDCSGIVSVRHGGGLPGYGSEWRFYPELGIGIVSLSNLTYGGMGGANFRALDTLITLAKLQPRILPASAILEQRKKEIQDLLSEWPQDKLGIFAENFFLDQSVDARKKEAGNILAQAGKILSVGEMMPENQLRGTYIIEGEQKDIAVFFTLTPEATPLVQQLDLTLVDK